MNQPLRYGLGFVFLVESILLNHRGDFIAGIMTALATVLLFGSVLLENL